MAFLSYTENTNGYSLPDNSELEIVYTSQEDIIQQQIAAAKEIADVVVVTCHLGRGGYLQRYRRRKSTGTENH